jgi:hypothetical protein
MKMSKPATREYIERIRGRYRNLKTKKAKSGVLDEFCAVTELERKHAIKVLRSRKRPLKRSGRKAIYGPEVAEALKDIWMEAVQPCSKLMHAIMSCYVSSYEKAHGAFEADIRESLLKVSVSSIDRLLKKQRSLCPRRRRSPMGVAAVKREVPIRAGAWEVTEPGWMEADTVAHSGGNMAGNFAWSLTMTDILTQWTEVRVMWNRGAAATFERIQEIEQAVPFKVQGFDSDNGPEFMNWHLLEYFREDSRSIEFTRSRAYHKNDNAHVEQKNGTHVRGLLGHERIEDPECVEALNQATRLWSLWKNLYSPTMKLVSKTRVGPRYKKRYDKPQTPAQRVLECPSIGEDQKKRIRRLLADTDCFTLKKNIDEALREVFRALHQRQQAQRRLSFPGSGPDPEPGKDSRIPPATPFRASLSRSKSPKRMVS